MEKSNLTYSFEDVYYTSKYDVQFKNLVINEVSFGDLFFNTIKDTQYTRLLQDIQKYQEIRKAYVELSDEELFTEIQTQIQNLLDMLAREKNYDNSFVLASYAESTIPRFRNEALKFIEFRDQCWSICYNLLNKYTSGEIERPSLVEVLGSLPVFEW